ncbi:MAG: hypothetical protein L0Z62_05425 [Gemmataceae bacterium]|nr:hypothetical protein [Gemmataceae bacterium]
MCVTLAAARLSETILYAAEVCPDGKDVVHVLGYQNSVQNLPAKGSPSGNAMVLPFPAVAGTMTQKNVVATDQCPHILEDLAKAVRWQDRGQPRGHIVEDATLGVEVFDTGIYTVVLAQDARTIPSALKRVPREKRPALNPPIFDAYAVWYPGWTVALCCFNNQEAARATPMLWWYQPANPDQLFAPALDCHSGELPDLDAKVNVDHTVAVASYVMDQEDFWSTSPRYRDRTAEVWDALEEMTRVRYQDSIPASVRPFLCDHAIGSCYDKKMPNGDFVCAVKKVREGAYGGKGVLRRVGPPGATASLRA